MSEIAFAEWECFYLIVGGAAGALIGLQFVVLTLITTKPTIATPEAGSAFATPTIIHFATVLFLSAMILAPWHATAIPAVLLGITGIGGIIYCIIIARLVQKQDAYRPQLEDWMFHVVLPTMAYGLLALSSFILGSYTHETSFGVAAAALILLFAGIHNAWDAVAYHVFVTMRSENNTQSRDGDSQEV